ncbi:BaiN/RdsA family NAD(P)/FAD-dependent oxidoreductase [Roseobacter sp. HKCCA0882]|uniref:NAD(P)/FAD-dependent oxidoreductase n=1 Tax=Roseobacter sp. HKCCA0882 TaxID=3120337 RepID=UPI0030EE367C
MAQLPQHHVSTLILGAGAAGMMAATHSGARVLVIDHAKAAGEKIRISGGGRCNFTNIYCDPSAFLSENPHFAKSALSRYGPYDFLDLVNRHRISWHEKTLGQLFCDTSAKEIIAMLRAEMAAVGAELWLETSISSVRQSGDKFCVLVEKQGQAREIYADHLVVATGGKSIPKMGATGLAYQIAETFGHRVTDTRPALVPFTFDEGQRARFAALAGLSLPVRAKAADAEFDEAMLFTHRGLSGPAILQISSYWREGHEITLHIDPETDFFAVLREARGQSVKRSLQGVLSDYLPKAFVADFGQIQSLAGNIADCSDARLREIVEALQDWRLRPTATEGYRTAEVTLGGVATDGLSSKTMQSTHISNLYFIGEAVDVTGWLGGYNFQWAWASAVAAGAAIRAKRQA